MDPLAVISEIGTYGTISAPPLIPLDGDIDINIVSSDLPIQDYDVIYQKYTRKNHLNEVFDISDEYYIPDSLIFNNIDALYSLSSHMGNYLATQTPGPFDFCEIGAPGGATEYFRRRRPDSYAFNYGNGPWKIADFDMGHVNIMYHRDINTGKLEFSNWVLNVNQLDLVISNETSNNEYQQFQRLLYDSYIALKTLKRGGHMIIKLGSIESQINRQMIYILTGCFTSSTLVAPFLAPEGQYFVGMNLLSEDIIFPTRRLLSDIIDENTFADVISIFDTPTPEYDEFIQQHNKMMLKLNYNLQDRYDYVKTWQTIK